MMSIVVDDYTFTVEQKLPSEEKSSVTYPNTLPDTFTRCLHTLLSRSHTVTRGFTPSTQVSHQVARLVSRFSAQVAHLVPSLQLCDKQVAHLSTGLIHRLHIQYPVHTPSTQVAHLVPGLQVFCTLFICLVHSLHIQSPVYMW